MLQKIGIEQTRQLLRACLVVHTYAMKNGRTPEVSLHISWERYFLVTLLRVVRFLQLLLDNNQAKDLIPYEMSLLTDLEAQLHFQVMALMSREV